MKQLKDMKKHKDHYQSIIDGMRLIEDLLIPQVTPRVPSHIRERARNIIQSFPSENEIKSMLDPVKATAKMEKQP